MTDKIFAKMMELAREGIDVTLSHNAQDRFCIKFSYRHPVFQRIAHKQWQFIAEIAKVEVFEMLIVEHMERAKVELNEFIKQHER